MDNKETTNDPRLAHTGVDVLGREIIDESVLLADFERVLEFGEALERDDSPLKEDAIKDMLAPTDTLLNFIDCHGRQLLEMAKKGADLSGMNKDNPKATAVEVAAAIWGVSSPIVDEGASGLTWEALMHLAEANPTVALIRDTALAQARAAMDALRVHD